MLFINILMLIIMCFSCIGTTFAIEHYTFTPLETQPTINNVVYDNNIVNTISYDLVPYFDNSTDYIIRDNVKYYRFMGYGASTDASNSANYNTLYSFLQSHKMYINFTILNVTYKCDCIVTINKFNDFATSYGMYQFDYYIDYSSLKNLKFNFLSPSDTSIVTTDLITVTFGTFNEDFSYINSNVTYTSNSLLGGKFDKGQMYSNTWYNNYIYLPKLIINYNGQNYNTSNYYYGYTFTYTLGKIYNVDFNSDFLINYSDLNIDSYVQYSKKYINTSSVYSILQSVNNIGNSYPNNMCFMFDKFTASYNNSYSNISFNEDNFNIKFSYGFQSDFIGFNIGDGGSAYGNLSADKFYRKSSGAFDIFTAVYNLFVYLIFEAPIFKDIFSFIALIIGFLKDCLYLLIDFIGSFGYFGIIFVGLLGFEIILKLLL